VVRKMDTQNHAESERAKRRAERHRLAAERAAAVLKSDGLMRVPEVLAVVPISESTWWVGVRSGRFPAGIKLGPRTTVWRASDIRDLLTRIGSESPS
jgi:prophage regulatory protein